MDKWRIFWALAARPWLVVLFFWLFIYHAFIKPILQPQVLQKLLTLTLLYCFSFTLESLVISYPTLVILSKFFTLFLLLLGGVIVEVLFEPNNSFKAFLFRLSKISSVVVYCYLVDLWIYDRPLFIVIFRPLKVLAMIIVFH